MITRTDILKTIESYNNRIGKVAFPYRMHINLDDHRKALEILNNFLNESTSTEIQLKDYNQLQQYTSAISLLESIKELPLFDNSPNEVRKIIDWHTIKFGFPPAEPIWFYLVPDVYKGYASWLSNARYIRIPDDFQKEAWEAVAPYYEMYKRSSSNDQKKMEQIMKALEMIKDPAVLFAKAKAKTDKDYLELVNLMKETNKDKQGLINHVYIDMKHDLPSDMVNAFLNSYSWLSSGIDSKYLITSATIKQLIHDVTASVKAGKEMKKTQDKEAQEAQDKKDTETLKNTGKELEDIENTDPETKEQRRREKFMDKWTNQYLYQFQNANQQADLFQTMVKESRDLAEEPSETDYKNMRFVGNEAVREYDSMINAAQNEVVARSKSKK